VLREMTDMGLRRESPNKPCFYKDIDSVYAGTWEPNTDIFETGDEVVIRLELANVSRDDISIKVKNGKLHIHGKRPQNIQTSQQVYFHQMEIHCGEFDKTIVLPDSLEHNEMTAVLEDGILEIRISKKSQPIEIPIAIKANWTE